jgi:hypothetical protein
VEFNTRSIYHLLSRTFSQCITISQIIDFDVFDIIAVCDIHLTIDSACAVTSSSGSRGRGFPNGAFGRTNRRDIDVLNALLRLDLRINLRGGGSCSIIPLVSSLDLGISRGTYPQQQQHLFSSQSPAQGCRKL